MIVFETGICPLCQRRSELVVEPDQAQRIYAWRSGFLPGSIQELLPDMSPAEREQLMNGTHEACFDRAFGK